LFNNDLSHKEKQVQLVTSFQELVSTSFYGEMNALCWSRQLKGDFSEIVKKVEFKENIAELSMEELHSLQLSEQGQIARETLLNDFQLLTTHGASPTLNLIKYYDRDDAYPFFFPTDVYSFHIDRSPLPTDTFLCTYHGEASEIVPNSQAQQKIHIPEIREELKKLYNGDEEGFEAFLKEHFFDLHYQEKFDAIPIKLGQGQLWKLAIDHPESQAMPCIHRAPMEKNNKTRLLMIC
tara:strand:+ start:2890 stop:3597 length:708 start_codon:yes stop_codon:yes gene_type:complete